MPARLLGFSPSAAKDWEEATAAAADVAPTEEDQSYAA